MSLPEPPKYYTLYLKIDLTDDALLTLVGRERDNETIVEMLHDVNMSELGRVMSDEYFYMAEGMTVTKVEEHDR